MKAEARITHQKAERDQAARGEFVRTPEAQRRPVLEHGPSEHRTYVRNRPRRAGRSRRFGELSGLAVLALVAAACSGHSSAAPSEDPNSGSASAPYDTAVVGAAPPHWTDEIPARIVFDETRTSRVGAPLGGRVTTVHVELGQAVKQGAPLVSVTSGDLTDLYSARDKAKVDLDAAQNNYKRVKELVDAKALPQKELTSAEQDLHEAQVTYAAANQKIASLKVAAGGAATFTITAPRDGVIVEKTVAVGQQVSPDNGAIITIADLSGVWVVADLLEDAVDDIRAGSKAEVTIEGIAKPVVDVVDQVAAIVDPDRHTVPVRVKLDNVAGTLRPNTLAQIRFFEDKTGPLSVPAEAILTDGATTYVYVIRNGTPHRTDVVAGPRNAKLIPIRSGLQAGEQVVTRGAVLLDNQILPEDRPK
jgi:RND family efflux transporter MFP subunit